MIAVRLETCSELSLVRECAFVASEMADRIGVKSIDVGWVFPWTWERDKALGVAWGGCVRVEVLPPYGRGVHNSYGGNAMMGFGGT